MLSVRNVRILFSVLVCFMGICRGVSEFRAASLVFPTPAQEQKDKQQQEEQELEEQEQKEQVRTIPVKESRFADNTLLWFAEGIEGTIEAMTGQIGLEPAGQILWETETPENPVSRKTLILIDNSVSVPAKNREKIRQLLEYLIRRRSSVEEIALAVYARKVTVLMDYTLLQEPMLQAAGSVTYQDQDAYMNDVLNELIHTLQEDKESGIFHRVLLISDGADDNPFGYSDTSLMNLLMMRSCIVDVVDSGRPELLLERKRLKEIADKSGGEYLYLEEWEDMEQAAGTLTDGNSLCRITIPVPYDCMDGLSRPVRVFITAGSTEYEAVREEQFPLIDVRFLSEWKQTEQTMEKSEETESFSVPETRTGLPQLPGTEMLNMQLQETESLIGQPAEKDSQLQKSQEQEIFHRDQPDTQPETFPPPAAVDTPGQGEHGSPETLQRTGQPVNYRSLVFRIAATAGVGAALGVLAYQIRKKLRNKEQEEPDDPEESWTYQSEFDSESGFLKEGRTVDKERQEGTETVMMWPQSEQSIVVLRDTADHSRFFRIVIEQDVIVGRNAQKCQVVIPGDSSISSRQALFTKRKEQICLEDMDSANGTYLNGNRVEGRVPLRDGDLLKIGKTELRVELG